MRYLTLLLFLLSPSTVWAGAPILLGNFTQGGLVFGRTEPDTRIEFDGRLVRVNEKGIFIFGFGRDFPARAILFWTPANGEKRTVVLRIKGRTYKTQRIEGLPN